MRAGSLRETVLVEYPVETINEYGESIQTWEPKLQCRAAIPIIIGPIGTGRQTRGCPNVPGDTSMEPRRGYANPSVVGQS